MDRDIDRDETEEEEEDHSAFTSTAVCSGGVAYGRMSFLLRSIFIFLFSSLSSLIRFGFPSIFISGLGVSQKPPIFLSFLSHILE